MTRFRLILDPPRSAVSNMATDEMLMLAQSRADAVPTLRFYSWSEEVLSLGYFQSVDAFSGMRGKRKPMTVIRRITGGGAVSHGKDLTFSLTAMLPNPYIPTGVKESYLKINEAVRVGLKQHLPSLDYADCRDVASMREKQKDRICFEKPDCHDLLLGGRKILGASQRRIGPKFLHQSSLMVDLASDTCISDILSGFKKVWNIDFDIKPLTQTELEQADEIGKIRYSDPAWYQSTSIAEKRLTA